MKIKYYLAIEEVERNKGDLTDSEFMTTYKYSNSEYTRKYLDLSQVKKLIQTLPWPELTEDEQVYFRDSNKNKDVKVIISLVKEKNLKKS